MQEKLQNDTQFSEISRAVCNTHDQWTETELMLLPRR